MSSLGVAAGLAVGVALLVAGMTKLARPSWVRDAGALGVPVWVARPVPVVELAVGAGLVTGLARRPLAWVAVALLVAFTAIVARSLAAGRRPVCACFGAWSSRPIGPTTLVRNAVLLVLAVVAGLAG